MRSLCSHCRALLPPLMLIFGCRLLSSYKRYSARPSAFRISSKNNSPSSNPFDTMAINNNRSSHYTVFIEGNVGSGKTTFLELFADSPNVLTVKEPVHKWQDVHGHNFLVSNFLSKFYVLHMFLRLRYSYERRQ